jgi:thymidylate kinase
MTDSSAMTVVISVIGSPGSGKSTLCTALARHYADAGLVVDHFEEEDILRRPEFSAVAAEFADGAGAVDPQTLIDAFGQYVARCLDDGIDLMITDALIPFIPSLRAWGHSEAELERIVARLEATAGVPVIIVMLTGDPESALRRAISRENDGWLNGYISKLSRLPGTSYVTSLSAAAGHLRQETEISRRLLTRTTWKLVEVDASDHPGQVAELVRRRLADHLPG